MQLRWVSMFSPLLSSEGWEYSIWNMGYLGLHIRVRGGGAGFCLLLYLYLYLNLCWTRLEMLTCFQLVLSWYLETIPGSQKFMPPRSPTLMADLDLTQIMYCSVYCILLTQALRPTGSIYVTWTLPLLLRRHGLYLAYFAYFA